MLSKNVNNKKYAPKLVFFNEKKIERDANDFETQILALPTRYTNSQNPITFFGCVDSWAFFSNFLPPT